MPFIVKIITDTNDKYFIKWDNQTPILTNDREEATLFSNVPKARRMKIILQIHYNNEPPDFTILDYKLMKVKGN